MDRLINAENHKEEMRRELVRYGVEPDNLYFVDTLPYKCPSPFTPAQAHRIEKKIYFKRIIDNDDIDAAISKMTTFGISENQAMRLKSNDWVFLKHTLLHEICEILNPTWEDVERDKWAFRELGI